MDTDLEKLTMLENMTIDQIKSLEARLKTEKDTERILFTLGLERNILSLIQILKDKAFRK